MKKQRITKQYLIHSLRSFLEEHLYTPITVRKISKYAKISTQPIYLQFSNMQNFKQAMIDDVLLEIHELSSKNEVNEDPLYTFWLNYYLFACQNRNLFFALFLNDIGCGSYLRDQSLALFLETAKESEVYQNAECEDIEKLHNESLIFFSGLVLIYVREENMQGEEEFLQEIKDYFYRTLIDPTYIYREILPQSVIDAGF
jgi:AcrR family transcriptional regulator